MLLLHLGKHCLLKCLGFFKIDSGVLKKKIFYFLSALLFPANSDELTYGLCSYIFMVSVWYLSVSLVISVLFFGSRETFQKMCHSLGWATLFAHPWMCILYWQSSPLLPGRPAPLAPCILRSTIPNQALWHKEAVQISGLDGINPGASLGEAFFCEARKSGLHCFQKSLISIHSLKKQFPKQCAVPRDVGKPVLPTEENIEHKSLHDFCKNSHIPKEKKEGGWEFSPYTEDKMIINDTKVSCNSCAYLELSLTLSKFWINRYKIELKTDFILMVFFDASTARCHLRINSVIFKVSSFV